MVFKKYPPGDFQGGGRCKEGDIYIRPPPYRYIFLETCSRSSNFQNKFISKI